MWARRWSARASAIKIGNAMSSTISERQSKRWRSGGRLGGTRSCTPQDFDRDQRHRTCCHRDSEIKNAERRAKQVAQTGNEQHRGLRSKRSADGSEQQRVEEKPRIGEDRPPPGATGESIKEVGRDKAREPDRLTGWRRAAEPRGGGLRGKCASGDQACIARERPELRRGNDGVLRGERRPGHDVRFC